MNFYLNDGIIILYYFVYLNFGPKIFELSVYGFDFDVWANGFGFGSF